MNGEKILVLLGSSFLLMDFALVILTPPAVGYEISIYDAYPSYFWIFLVLAIGCGIATLLRTNFAQKGTMWWRAGMAIVILGNTIFLLLPAFRGYAVYGRGDTLTHLGYIEDVLKTGYIGQTNFYPFIHVLGASLIEITGLPLESIPIFYFVFFSAVYLFGVHLLARITSDKIGQILLITALASPLIYSTFNASIHPATLSLFFMPILISVFQKAQNSAYDIFPNTIVLLVMSFSFVFFHPVTVLLLVAVFFMFGIANSLHSRVYRNLSDARMGRRFKNRNSSAIGLFIIVCFSTWYLSFNGVQQELQKFSAWVLHGTMGNLAQSSLTLLSEADLSPFQTMQLFINRYGAQSILLIVTCLGCVLAARTMLRRRRVERLTFIYVGLFLMAFLTSVIMLTGYFPEKEPIRVIRLPLFVGTVLSGLVFCDHLWKYTSGRFPVGRIGLFLMIMSMVILGMINVYRSPYTYDVNGQVTRMEISGTKWFENAKDPQIGVITNTPTWVTRFENFNFGVDTSPLVADFPDRSPSHFGYDTNDSIAKTLGFKDKYLVVFEVDKLAPNVFPENVRPKVHQYTEEDFSKLSSDPSAVRLYSNGEFEVWAIVAHTR